MTSILFFVQCIIKQLLIRFGFSDTQNNQGLSKDYHPQISASIQSQLDIPAIA